MSPAVLPTPPPARLIRRQGLLGGLFPSDTPSAHASSSATDGGDGGGLLGTILGPVTSALFPPLSALSPSSTSAGSLTPTSSSSPTSSPTRSSTSSTTSTSSTSSDTTTSTTTTSSTTSSTSSTTSSTSSTTTSTPSSVSPSDTPTPSPTPLVTTSGTTVITLTSHLSTPSAPATHAAVPFLHNTPAEAAVFTIAGVLALLLLFLAGTAALRRRARARLHTEAVDFAPFVPIGDEEKRGESMEALALRRSGSSSSGGADISAGHLYGANVQAYYAPPPPQHAYRGPSPAPPMLQAPPLARVRTPAGGGGGVGRAAPPLPDLRAPSPMQMADPFARAASPSMLPDPFAGSEERGDAKARTQVLKVVNG